MPIYTQTSPRKDDEPFPAMLAIGDSWFWYPAANNLMEALIRNPAVKSVYKAIQLFGYNGAEVTEYVGNGRYAANFKNELVPGNLQYYSAFAISGGGNDAVRFKLAVKSKCGGLNDPADCIDEDKLDQLLGDISGAIGHLIHDILWAVQRDMKSGARKNDVDIFLHGYDYPVPDGRGFSLGGFDDLELAGPWLKPALDEAEMNPMPGFRLAFCKIMMDRLNAMLATFDGAGNGRVHFIRSTGILSSDQEGGKYKLDWANEMHPTGAGFDRIFAQSWLPVLKQQGYA